MRGCSPLWWPGRTSGQGDGREGTSPGAGRAAHAPLVPGLQEKPPQVQGEQQRPPPHGRRTPAPGPGERILSSCFLSGPLHRVAQAQAMTLHFPREARACVPGAGAKGRRAGTAGGHPSPYHSERWPRQLTAAPPPENGPGRGSQDLPQDVCLETDDAHHAGAATARDRWTGGGGTTPYRWWDCLWAFPAPEGPRPPWDQADAGLRDRPRPPPCLASPVPSCVPLALLLRALPGDHHTGVSSQALLPGNLT